MCVCVYRDLNVYIKAYLSTFSALFSRIFICMCACGVQHGTMRTEFESCLVHAHVTLNKFLNVLEILFPQPSVEIIIKNISQGASLVAQQ